jgi:hypothetical protein
MLAEQGRNTHLFERKKVVPAAADEVHGRTAQHGIAT